MDDGPIAEGITGKLGDPIPTATPEQLQIFQCGKTVLLRHFDLADGLGPAFNLTSCGGCHERPATGGSAGLYRNFFIAARRGDDGSFTFSESAGMAGGVLRVFNYGTGNPARPTVPTTANVFAQRNPIPMFGMGLLAEIPEEEILSHVDEDDADGDGISGRANFDRGFVSRFGRKAQTASLEGFIRGPLFNHLGITTAPLTDAERSQLPVDSAAQATLKAIEQRPFEGKDSPHMQAAAPAEPNHDDDAAVDPELSSSDLFDIVSFSMLLAAPKFETPTVQSNQGRLLFHEANCSVCHLPRLNGPRGAIPAYTDLLLHDMGVGLADGIEQLLATGSEFRTQPLWGVSAVGPYLHDGRAETLEAAILAHGGEALAARNAFAAFTDQQRDDVIEFLLSLGGRDQYSAGLVESNRAIPAVGAYGGPFRALTTDEQNRFLRGRAVYDRDFGFADGVGAMKGATGGTRFNGDSCRACHLGPTIAGAGPRDVNVMRNGTVTPDGTFVPPPDTPNTILHKQIHVGSAPALPAAGTNVFEHRQTPHNFGLGLMDSIPDATIMASADPVDADGDGISGRAHVLSDGRLGRFGWKAQVPTLAEFVRDAFGAELGITLPAQTGMTFGLTGDDDDASDPELNLSDVEDMNFFLSMLAPPPRQETQDAARVAQGEAVFASLGCTKCHVPALSGTMGDVPLYSDLLLHEILPAGSIGIVDGDAQMREFRTTPLWGLSQTAPYFHSGEADTIDDAIRLHDGEAAEIRRAYELLTSEERDALLAFLGTL